MASAPWNRLRRRWQSSRTTRRCGRRDSAPIDFCDAGFDRDFGDAGFDPGFTDGGGAGLDRDFAEPVFDVADFDDGEDADAGYLGGGKPDRHRRPRRLRLARWGDKSRCRELVDDCEAFLGGRYLARAESRTLTVPVWAWLNVLAHGSQDDLRQTVGESRGMARGWRAARAYLAAEVLEVEARGRSLAELQREVLVPLELQLADRADVQSWTPQRWAAVVRTSIDAYGRSTRP